ncbi:MAG: ATP-sensitive inward rectifier potassium channel 10 [Verrucomicrobia bacterium]|nr:ATP-sensitive inward rectifier potassium channel 10 [Verrucomicrobiota bacterium]
MARHHHPRFHIPIPIPGRVTVRSGNYEFVKLNTKRFDFSDTYHLILTLSWPRFALFVAGIYLLINFGFAILYVLGPGSIAEMPPGSFGDAFFFSVETLATVGYGHMYPQALYGHIVATAEIITGMFGMAVITGLIFIRFSRPTAKIRFSKLAVITQFDGAPHLMIRVANLRHQAMAEAHFRLVMLYNKRIPEEEDDFRFFEDLKLRFNHVIVFPVVMTLRHRIDEDSPLYGLTEADLRALDLRIMASIVATDTVTCSEVGTASDYGPDQILWNYRFAEIYTEGANRQWVVDYGRIDDVEPSKVQIGTPNLDDLPEDAEVESTVPSSDGERIED